MPLSRVLRPGMWERSEVDHVLDFVDVETMATAYIQALQDAILAALVLLEIPGRITKAKQNEVVSILRAVIP